jgi:hypothetical protein
MSIEKDRPVRLSGVMQPVAGGEDQEKEETDVDKA